MSIICGFNLIFTPQTIPMDPFVPPEKILDFGPPQIVAFPRIPSSYILGSIGYNSYYTVDGRNSKQPPGMYETL